MPERVEEVLDTLLDEVVSELDLALVGQLEVHQEVLFAVPQQVGVFAVSVADGGEGSVEPGVLGVVPAEGQAGQTGQLGVVRGGHHQLDILLLLIPSPPSCFCLSLA